MTSEQDGAGAGRYTVKSVARALRLVGIVADGPAEGQTLSELATALGISKSSTLALARTLEAAGFLRYLCEAGMTTGLIRTGRRPRAKAIRPPLAQIPEPGGRQSAKPPPSSQCVRPRLRERLWERL